MSKIYFRERNFLAIYWDWDIEGEMVKDGTSNIELAILLGESEDPSKFEFVRPIFILNDQEKNIMKLYKKSVFYK